MGSRTDMMGQMFAQMQSLQGAYDFLMETCNISYENHSMIQTMSGLLVPDKQFVRIDLEFIGVPKIEKGGETK